jgi:hypothetical protein
MSKFDHKGKHDSKYHNPLLWKILLFAAGIFISGISIVFAQETKICIVETKEYSGKDPYMWDGLYAASDDEGNVYMSYPTAHIARLMTIQ